MLSTNLARGAYLAAGLVVAFASAARIAAAQPLPLPVPTVALPGFSPDDVARMHAAAARLYEGRSIGTIERWRNPDTKDAGEVQLISSFSAGGMPCHSIRYTIRYEGNQNRLDHYVINWCRVPGGDWTIIELPHRSMAD
jgi:hypothetical protein